MQPHFGQPLKGISLRAGGLVSHGEAVISASGLEGGGIYPLTPALRTGAGLRIDLMPGQSRDQLRAKLERSGPKTSLSNRLRKAGLTRAKSAMVMECARNARDLATAIRDLGVAHQGVAPLDQAISTAGGLRFRALTDGLMLRDRPGTFACGEMLDWEAPTGGYLLTACLATGRMAGRAAAACYASS